MRGKTLQFHPLQRPKITHQEINTRIKATKAKKLPSSDKISPTKAVEALLAHLVSRTVDLKRNGRVVIGYT